MVVSHRRRITWFENRSYIRLPPVVPQLPVRREWFGKGHSNGVTDHPQSRPEAVLGLKQCWAGCLLADEKLLTDGHSMWSNWTIPGGG